ncbi:hypothetical protein Clim_1335 [Chlorobium limicola DSM 245]|jgi:hypothetical protein|uniref:Uncharacterized protein n=1 Tax=Chlorobium limicola (strain DSM 245 / NBRC 103803 / 6330) TaxID=290315 RepID=B3ECX2_CHLL2|nr:hypothetical protein Clim_1335 [Chlorobium limicola DSM 245]
MSGDVYVRFCENLRVKLPRTTHPYSSSDAPLPALTKELPSCTPSVKNGFTKGIDLDIFIILIKIIPMSNLCSWRKEHPITVLKRLKE